LDVHSCAGGFTLVVVSVDAVFAWLR